MKKHLGIILVYTMRLLQYGQDKCIPQGNLLRDGLAESVFEYVEFLGPKIIRLGKYIEVIKFRDN